MGKYQSSYAFYRLFDLWRVACYTDHILHSMCLLRLDYCAVGPEVSDFIVEPFFMNILFMVYSNRSGGSDDFEPLSLFISSKFEYFFLIKSLSDF